MLTGRRPFEGRDVSEVLGAVLRVDPDWDALPESTPPLVRFFLRRSLAREPTQRVHDIADVRLAMEGTFETTGTVPADASVRLQVPVWQRPTVIAVILVTAVLAGIAGRWLVLPEAVSAGLVRLAITPQEATRLDLENGGLDRFHRMARRSSTAHTKAFTCSPLTCGWRIRKNPRHRSIFMSLELKSSAKFYR